MFTSILVIELRESSRTNHPLDIWEMMRLCLVVKGTVQSFKVQLSAVN